MLKLNLRYLLNLLILFRLMNDLFILLNNKVRNLILILVLYLLLRYIISWMLNI
jgi:hypothetical protein